MKASSMLWRIQAPQVPWDSFLFGTMHVMDKSFLKKLPDLQVYLFQANILALETNLDHLHQSDAAHHLLPDGMTLPNLIPGPKLQKLGRILKKVFNLDIRPFYPFQPIFLNNFISQKILVESGVVSPEAWLWERGGRLQMQLTGLQSIQSQLGYVEKINLDYQVQSLLTIGRNPGKFRRELLDLSEIYLSQDLPALHRKLRRSGGGLRKFLLFERNQLMTRSLLEMHQMNPTFAAVGAGHLWGGKGILRKLKNAGCTVRPVFW